MLTKTSKSPKEDTTLASASLIKALLNLDPYSLNKVATLKHPDSASYPDKEES